MMIVQNRLSSDKGLARLETGYKKIKNNDERFGEEMNRRQDIEEIELRTVLDNEI